MTEFVEQNIEITREQIAGWHPFFALPCYDQQVTEPFFMSMMRLGMAFKDIGLNFSVSTIGDSLISRARNQLVAKFLANPDYTHLIFIDVDLSFIPDDVIKMLWHDQEIVTGAYPIKDINWERVVRLVNEGEKPENLLRRATRFVVNPAKSGGKENVLRVENGAIAIYDAGTGFMCIKREAFLKMIEAYPELKYNDDTGALHGEERDWSYAFFNSYIDDDGRFLSEDYGFCRYWQRLGGDVWVDPSIELTHLGRLRYPGKLMEYLQEIIIS